MFTLLFMLSNVLVVFNTSIPASATDATAYLAARNLPVNLLGINFGTTPGPLTFAQTANGARTVQSFMWRGSSDSSFNGRTLNVAIDPIARAHPLDAIVLATYTPVVFQNQDSTLSTTPGRLARMASISTFGADVIAHGRIGSSVCGCRFHLRHRQ